MPFLIEGATKDNYLYNYELSNKRSLSLYIFLKWSMVKFDPGNGEMQIAGSGFRRVGRVAQEANNHSDEPKIEEIK